MLTKNLNIMKTIANFIIAASMVLTSCSTVVFKEVAPKAGNELTYFPKEIVGKYTDVKSKDTLMIGQTDFQYANKDAFFHLEGNLSDEKTVLKKKNDFYILNVKMEKEPDWLVIPFKYEKDKIYVYYLMIDKDTDDKEELRKYRKEKLEKLRSITRVERIKDTISKNKNYRIDPTDRELDELFKNEMFVKIIEFKKL